MKTGLFSRKSGILVVLLVAFALVATGCINPGGKQNQPKLGSLEGSVRSYATGERLEVEAMAVIDGKVVTITNGTFHITGLEPGVHKLYVTAEGYIDTEISVVIEAEMTSSASVALVSTNTDGVEITLAALREAKRRGDIDLYMQYHTSYAVYRAHPADGDPPLVFNRDQIRALYGSDFEGPNWSYTEEDEDIFLIEKIIEHTPEKVILFREGEISLFWVELVPYKGMWRVSNYDAHAK